MRTHRLWQSTLHRASFVSAVFVLLRRCGPNFRLINGSPSHTAGMMQEHEEYYDGRPNVWGRFAGSRLGVILPGFVGGAILSGAWCLCGLSGSVDHRLLAWTLILAGPFTALKYEVTSAGACVCLLASPAIFAHPIRRSGWTGVVTIAALTLWFFLGWATVLMIYFAT